MSYHDQVDFDVPTSEVVRGLIGAVSSLICFPKDEDLGFPVGDGALVDGDACCSFSNIPLRASRTDMIS